MSRGRVPAGVRPDRPGFALPLALVLMLVATTLALGSLRVAQLDMVSNRAIRTGGEAMRAAEAGAARTVLRWHGSAAPSLAPGDSTDTGWVDLPDASVARTAVLRVDDGTGLRRYRLRSTGRPGPTATAQRSIVTVVEVPPAPTVDAALAMRGGVQVLGGGPPGTPEVDGRDGTPPGWAGAGVCGGTGADMPGVLIDDEDDVQLLGPIGQVDGDPPILEDAGLGAPALGDMTYEELTAVADVRFTGDTFMPGPYFATGTGGECLKDDPENWGNPSPGGACWDYLPTVHVAGDLTVSGSGAGQGILLVDGDLTIQGPLEFYGIVIVQGRVDIRDGEIVGGLLVDGVATSYIQAPASVSYSSCAVDRAASTLVVPQPLAGRHWFETG